MSDVLWPVESSTGRDQLPGHGTDAPGNNTIMLPSSGEDPLNSPISLPINDETCLLVADRDRRRVQDHLGL